MNIKKCGLIGLFVVLVLVLGIIIYNKFLKNINNDTVDDIKVKLDTSDDYESINWDNYDVSEVNLTKSLKIDEDGIYKLSGSLNGGNITINTNGNVKLILDNITIKSNNGPAIMVENAKNVVIYLNEDTENYLEDSSNFSGLDEDVSACVFSKDDLIFEGKGALTVKANYKDAIVSKDDLRIVNGSYNIVSEDDGIRGKDSVYIIDGNFNIISKGDAIKSTNTTDSIKGFIFIQNGKFEINATLDGIQAETSLLIENGEFNITTGGGYTNQSDKDTWGRWGNTLSSDSESAKAIKAGSNLVIKSGKFVISSSDDSIHSNGSIGISGGNFDIGSGDDGVHADERIVIDEGNINVKESYEGIEASNIVINGGNISVKSRDDGINVAGGNDESGMNRPGQNNFKSTSNNKLVINNGNVYVNASGDGIDSNGSVYVYGGVIYVDGPTDGGNGALDYDGEFVMDAGTLIAVGYRDMAQGVSDNSKQYNVMINLAQDYNGGTISLVSEDGTVLETYTPSKSFNNIVISSGRLEKSNTYKIEINGQEIETFTIQSISTILGNSFPGFGGGNQGGRPNDNGRGPRR